MWTAALAISVLASSIGPFMTGFHMGVLNPILPALAEDLSLSPSGQNLMFSILILAAAVGALGAGKLADGLGLLKAQEVMAVLFTTGGFMCTVASAPAPLIIMSTGRLLVGLACGACTVLQPRYIGEISPASVRGLLSSSMQLSLVIGILVAYLFGIPYEHDVSHISVGGLEFAWWRVVLLLGVFGSATQLILLLWSVQSPVWLTSRGRLAEASNVSTKLRASSTAESDAEEPLLPQPQAGTVSLVEVFSTAQFRRSMLLAVAVAVFQQLSGINTVIFYSTGILQQCGVQSPIYATVLVGTVNVLGTAVSAYLVDSAGRKLLLVMSHAGCFISLAIMTSAIYTQGLEKAAFTSVLALLAFVASFALGCGPVPFIYVGEILAPEIKGLVASIAMAANWVANSIVTATFPLFVTHVGLWPTYAGYSILNLAAVALFAVSMPETRRLDMTTIQRYFMDSP